MQTTIAKRFADLRAEGMDADSRLSLEEVWGGDPEEEPCPDECPADCPHHAQCNAESIRAELEHLGTIPPGVGVPVEARWDAPPNVARWM